LYAGVGDFNGDGHPDIVLTNNWNGGTAVGSISTLLGTGDGSFVLAGPPLTLADDIPQGVAVADFNRDGKLDVAVNEVGQIEMLLGNGNGTFTSKGTFGISASSNQTAESVVTADFNGDGIPDLAYAPGGDAVPVLLGNGDGTFHQAPGAASTFTGASAVAVGDFNGDGRPDLAIADGQNPGVVRILLDHADGSMTPASPPTLPAGQTPFGIVTGDFNGDGKVDIAVADLNGDQIFVYLGHGDGTFSAAPGSPFSDPVSLPWSLAAADVNGDGHLDLIIGHNGPGIEVALGNGNGTFSLQPDATLANGTWTGGLVVGDFNGDLQPDIVSPNGDTTVSSFLDTAAARMRVAPAALGFSATRLGAATGETATVTNDGTGVLRVSGISITGADAGDFALGTNTCTRSVLFVGGSCQLTVGFAPKVAGARAATLSILSNAPGAPTTVTVAGTGAAAAAPTGPSLHFARRTISVSVRRLAGVALGCPTNDADAPCQGKLSLIERVIRISGHGRHRTRKHVKIKLGAASFSIPAGGSATVPIRISKSSFASLSLARHLTVTGSAVAHAGASLSRTTTITLTLRAPATPHPRR
jgi:hypothetical protein